MSLLTQPKAQRLLSHLAWLDLSQNPELLRNPLESQDWMALWRLAPLRHLDLTVTGMTAGCATGLKTFWIYMICKACPRCVGAQL